MIAIPATDAETHYRTQLSRRGVPALLHAGLIRYLVDHIQPGSFLTAVLENNLTLALAHADEANRAALWPLVSFLNNDAPDLAWGSRQTVAEWVARANNQEPT